MPVLPPTLESTCASSVVGICTRLHAAPRDRRGEAGEVADRRRRRAPPPRRSARAAIPGSPRRRSAGARSSSSLRRAERRSRPRRCPRSSSDARSAGRWRSATFASVTTTALRPGKQRGDPLAGLGDQAGADRQRRSFARQARRERARCSTPPAFRSRWASSAATISPTTA